MATQLLNNYGWPRNLVVIDSEVQSRAVFFSNTVCFGLALLSSFMYMFSSDLKVDKLACMSLV